MWLVESQALVVVAHKARCPNTIKETSGAFFIWVAFKIWTPKILRLGKVGVKVGISWPIGAGLIL